jgi:hypothetical protein
MLGHGQPPVQKVTTMTLAGLFRPRPSQRRSTLAALMAALGVAAGGALAWGLLALAVHRQLLLLALAIGAGVGLMIARYRAGHLPTIIAGAVLAELGCAAGTLLGQVLRLLGQHVSLSVITSHFGAVLRAFPANVGWFGLLFYAVACVAAIRLPLQAARPAPATAGTEPPAQDSEQTPAEAAPADTGADGS